MPDSNMSPMQLQARGQSGDTDGKEAMSRKGERHWGSGGRGVCGERFYIRTLLLRGAFVALCVSLEQAVAFFSPPGPSVRPRWSPDAGRSINVAARRGLRPAHAGLTTCYEFRSAECYLRVGFFKEFEGPQQQAALITREEQPLGSWRPKTLPRTLRQSSGNEHAEHHSTATLLRGREASTTLLQTACSSVVGHGIRSRNRVAVGHGISSRSRMATLGQGAGTIGRTSALPALVNKLQSVTLRTVERPGRRMNLDLSLTYVERVREEVSTSYREGQRAMTQLGELLTMTLTDGAHECRSTVRAELWESAEADEKVHFSLSEAVPLEHVLQGSGSLELAQEQLRGLVVNSCGKWRGARVVDHSVDFDALEQNGNGVMRIITHARPSSELVRLIVDSMFGIDCAELEEESEIAELTEGDDKFGSMYHIQVLVETGEQAAAMYEHLRTVVFDDSHLRQLGVEGSADTCQFELVSKIDNTLSMHILWRGVGMIIQVQTLDAHFMASELSIMAERAKERATRQAVRNEVFEKKFESRTPFMRFQRNLLEWTLASDGKLTSPPSCDNVTVKLSHMTAHADGFEIAEEFTDLSTDV